jgi:hypothetical protein
MIGYFDLFEIYYFGNLNLDLFDFEKLKDYYYLY